MRIAPEQLMSQLHLVVGHLGLHGGVESVKVFFVCLFVFFQGRKTRNSQVDKESLLGI